MVLVLDTTFQQLPTTVTKAAKVHVQAKQSWDQQPGAGQSFDPKAAGRRAVRRHQGALRKLAE